MKKILLTSLIICFSTHSVFGVGDGCVGRGSGLVTNDSLFFYDDNTEKLSDNMLQCDADYCANDIEIFVGATAYIGNDKEVGKGTIVKCKVEWSGDYWYANGDIHNISECLRNDIPKSFDLVWEDDTSKVYCKTLRKVDNKYKFCVIKNEQDICKVVGRAKTQKNGLNNKNDDKTTIETEQKTEPKKEEPKNAEETKPVVGDNKKQEPQQGGSQNKPVTKKEVKNTPAAAPVAAKNADTQKQTVKTWNNCAGYVDYVYNWIVNKQSGECPNNGVMNICNNKVLIDSASTDKDSWITAAKEICEGKSCDVKFNTVIKCDNEEIKLNNEKISLTPEEMQSVTKTRILTCKQFNSEYATNGDVAGQFIKSKGKCGTLVYNKKDAEEKARQAEAERQEQERIKREKAELKKKFDAAADDLVPFFSKVESERSVWKNADGSFNATRLASDLTAGVVLGTVGGVVSGVLIKKAQVEKGFDALNCSVGGQKVADWGDEFKVGFKR